MGRARRPTRLSSPCQRCGYRDVVLHCDVRTCSWYVCEVCEIVYDLSLGRSILGTPEYRLRLSRPKAEARPKAEGKAEGEAQEDGGRADGVG